MTPSDRDRPVYMISVAAELTGVHPQTLRIYERKALVQPQRSQGNTRRYSEADIERLRLIQELTQNEGVNLAGVTRIIEMDRQIQRLRGELEAARRRVRALEAALVRAQQGPVTHTALVRIQTGPVMRRMG